MNLSRRYFVFGTCATGLSVLAPPVEAGVVQSLSGPAFGSRWNAVLPEYVDGAVVTDIVAVVVADIDAKMSPYRATSALSLFNRSRTTGWMSVGTDMARLAAMALRLHRVTDGAFDPTVGPLVRRFGFGPIVGRYVGPASLETAPGHIRKRDPEVTLDLCGIAKGHALDRVIAALKETRVTDALIELGGEIRTLGRHPSGREWMIGVAGPVPGASSLDLRIAPRGLAVATSGHANQSYSGLVGAVSHLIDPHQGRPARQDLASVTVLADSAEQADARATALAVAGRNLGPDLAERHGWKALFVLQGNGRPHRRMTGGFETHLLI